ncbi:uncharacterized protein H6S33_007510 [Morchella sextelata]|uniref:uncharacterized protein n=1 Tax=Morchella sextelata TaxID=1174677 RepID=UPI001D053948|nr:uncharacterized protein H6S33_007510 [Morchella sextelata]KAH0603851.1 hypothetical protein H6S33_007510 [Morchella sextelata]
MDVYYYFNYLSAGWMMLESIPLIASPTVIITMLSPDVRETTQLEAYLSRSLGFTLIAFSILNLLLTGSVPLVSSFSETAVAKPAGTDMEDPTAPYAVPSLCVTLTYHLTVAFYCYTQWDSGYSAAYAVAMVMHSLFSALGAWVLLFGSTSGRISRKTGADKRTSGFPFKNVEAEKKKSGKKSL